MEHVESQLGSEISAWKGLAATLLLASLVFGTPVALWVITGPPDIAKVLSGARTAMNYSGAIEPGFLRSGFCLAAWGMWLFIVLVSIVSLFAEWSIQARQLRRLKRVKASDTLASVSGRSAVEGACPDWRIPDEGGAWLRRLGFTTVNNPLRLLSKNVVALAFALLPSAGIAAPVFAAPSLPHSSRPISNQYAFSPPATIQATSSQAIPSSDSSSRAVQSNNDSYEVVAGDSLWSIAASRLNNPYDWPQIFQANQGVPQANGSELENPDLIYPGWVLSIPGSPSASSTITSAVTQIPQQTVVAANVPVTSAPAPQAQTQAPVEKNARQTQAPVEKHARQTGERGIGSSGGDALEAGLAVSAVAALAGLAFRRHKRKGTDLVLSPEGSEELRKVLDQIRDQGERADLPRVESEEVDRDSGIAPASV